MRSNHFSRCGVGCTMHFLSEAMIGVGCVKMRGFRVSAYFYNMLIFPSLQTVCIIIVKPKY